MEEKVFADGLYYNEPNQNAPEFVLGSLSFSQGRFIDWISAQAPDEKGYIRVDIKRSKEGKIYCQLNTYKKQ